MSAFWLSTYNEETMDMCQRSDNDGNTVFFYINFCIGNLLFRIYNIMVVIDVLAYQTFKRMPCSLLSVKHIVNPLNILLLYLLSLDSTISHVKSKQCNLPFA